MNKLEFEEDEKLELAAKIVSRFAHDSNNILGAIEGYISLIEGYANIKEFKQDLMEILRAISKHTELNRKILSFARRTETYKENINIKSFIEEISSDLNKISNNLTIKINENIELKANKEQLKQLLFVIIKNSYESGENIKIELIIVENQNFIEFSVKDNGTGISKENLKRIFEPFFTTKRNSQGLGLSIAYGIVRRHKGKISIETEENKGTNFKIILPKL